MSKFKKIYIEITNRCNLNCSFCLKDNKEKRDMTIKEFEVVLQKIEHYTDYIYLHVKGEPLLHKELKKIINLCEKYNKNVNITTNGVLLKSKKDILKNVRQINISLQSLTKIELLDEIIEVVEELSKHTYISYRLWTRTALEKEIIQKLEQTYNTKIESNQKLAENIFINFDNEFIWPSLDNNELYTKGSCYGTREHIGILSDGTVIPCCLDGNGVIKLGNIFNQSLEDVFANYRFCKMKIGFENNKLEEELCRKCGFRKG